MLNAGLLFWNCLAVNRKHSCSFKSCVSACWKCACMVYAERDENGLADKGYKLLWCVRRCVRVYKVPVINTLDHKSDHHASEGATMTTSGSLRLYLWYSWSLAHRLLRLHTLMCKLSVIARHNALSACVRPWLTRYVTRWSIRSCSSDTATLNDVSYNDLIYYTIILSSWDLKLIILLSRENKVLLSRDLEKIILLSRENGGNKLAITGKWRK